MAITLLYGENEVIPYCGMSLYLQFNQYVDPGCADGGWRYDDMVQHRKERFDCHFHEKL